MPRRRYTTLKPLSENKMNREKERPRQRWGERKRGRKISSDRASKQKAPAAATPVNFSVVVKGRNKEAFGAQYGDRGEANPSRRGKNVIDTKSYLNVGGQ